MAKYQVPEIDLSTRLEIVTEMMRPAQERGWGRVTELAQRHGLSRTWLYQLKAKAEAALTACLQPQAVGRKEKSKELVVDRAFINRAISILPLLKGSIRDIEIGLELLFGVKRSSCYINQRLQEIGKRAAAYNQTISTEQPILGEVDEIFQGREPCLTVVDGHSFLLLNFSPAEARGETEWGVTLLELEAQGFTFADVVADGAKGIAAGVAATEWDLTLCPDLFHVLHEAHPISKRLERLAYQAIEQADQSRLVVAEQAAPKRRRGKPRQAKLPLAEAEKQEAAAIELFDLWQWLLREVRLALEPISPTGYLSDPSQARTTLSTAVTLLSELGRDDVTKFTTKLEKQLDALLAPLRQLEERLASVRAELTPAMEKEILRAWQQRQGMDASWKTGLPSAWQETVSAFEAALLLFHRTSSLAESIHAWIRPYLQIHRGMPSWLAALLQLFWNHHRFQRGKRAGSTPLELAGCSDSLSLAQVFDALLAPDLQPSVV